VESKTNSGSSASYLTATEAERRRSGSPQPSSNNHAILLVQILQTKLAMANNKQDGV